MKNTFTLILLFISVIVLNAQEYMSIYKSDSSQSELLIRKNNLPSALRTISVCNASQLTSALSNALPGDSIILADGSYSGFTVNNSGDSGAPVVIMSANTGSARINGNVILVGHYLVLVGMNMQSHEVVIEGSHNRVSQSYFKNSLNCGIYLATSATYAEVDYNELEGGAGHSGNDLADAIMIRTKSSGVVHNHHVHHNYLHGAVLELNSDAISSGYGSTGDGNSIIEYNLVENWKGGKYCFYEKGGANIWRYNTSIGANAEDRGIVVRTNGSSRNNWVANWFEDCDLILFGGNSKVIGNRVANGTIHLGCGTVPVGTAGDPNDGGTRFAATNTLAAGNVGTIALGKIYSSGCQYPAKDITIEKHEGNISYGNHQGTKVAPSTCVNIPEAFRLDPSQVGPRALKTGM